MKRLGIFAFYDREGIVDDYVLFLLKKIKPFLAHLICVVNGELQDEGRRNLSEICDEILQRENKGFDISAYRYGISSALEREFVYDEVVFFNTTFYGPINSFDCLFSKMDKKDVDFWGITRHSRTNTIFVEGSGLDYVPEHIQSYFFAVRNKMFLSSEFINYWSDMNDISSYDEAIIKHELVFTKCFEDKGFKWDTFIETTLEDDFYQYVLMSNPVMLLKTQSCPVIKRKVFLHTVPDQPLVPLMGTANNLFCYLKEKTDYDVKMIVDNILRCESVVSYEDALFSHYYIEDVVSKTQVSSSISAFIRIDSADHVEHYLRLIDNGIKKITFLCSSSDVENDIKKRHSNVSCIVDNKEKTQLFQLVDEDDSEYVYVSQCCFRNGNSFKSGTEEYIFEMEELYRATVIMSDVQKLVSLLQREHMLKVIIPITSQLNGTLSRKRSFRFGNIDGRDLSALRSASYTFFSKKEYISKAMRSYFDCIDEGNEHMKAVPAMIAKENGGLVGIVWTREIERSLAMMYLPVLREANNWGRLMAKYDNARAFMKDFLVSNELKERMWTLLLSLSSKKRGQLYDEYKTYLIERDKFPSEEDYL